MRSTLLLVKVGLYDFFLELFRAAYHVVRYLMEVLYDVGMFFLIILVCLFLVFQLIKEWYFNSPHGM